MRVSALFIFIVLAFPDVTYVGYIPPDLVIVKGFNIILNGSLGLNFGFNAVHGVHKSVDFLVWNGGDSNLILQKHEIGER